MLEKSAIESTSSPEIASIPSDKLDILPAQDNEDEALDFLRQHRGDGHFAHDYERMRRLRRRIDIRVIPFLALSYLMNFMDKILLNYSNVMGVSEDLKLTANDFSNAATAFWIAVVIAEIPNIYILQRVPAGKYLAFCLFGWSVATACTSAVQNYEGLLACRIIGGAFESGIPPSLMLISGQWYTRREQISRFVWWYLGTAGGLAVGGFTSWCFQHVSPTAEPLNGWRIMYIVLGIITFCLGTAIFFLVPDTPMQARFLTDQEKVSHLEHVKANQTGIENKQGFSFKQLREALTDLQLWGQWLIMLLNGCGGGVITTYSATLIYGFGYSTRHAALLNMGSSAVAITACLLAAYGVKYFGNRWLCTICYTIPTIIGAGLMAYSPPTNKSALLAGIYIVYCSFAGVPIQFAWVTTNVAGHTKKSVASTILTAAFAMGNIIGPQTFRAEDAPAYTPAKTAMMSFQCCILAVAVALGAYYKLENRKRDKEVTAAGEDIAESTAYAGMTDKENRRFRYAY